MSYQAFENTDTTFSNHNHINDLPMPSHEGQPLGLTYAQVHALFTIPIATALYFLARPLIYTPEKIILIFLLTAAMVYTTPWDNYIIANGAWSYPPGRATDAPIGYVPLEEYFFFFIQTLMSGLFSILITRWDLHVLKLKAGPEGSSSAVRYGPIVGMLGLAVWGWIEGKPSSLNFYLGSICWWVMPILAFQWWIAGTYIWRNRRKAAIGILVPTAYLCFVDHTALREGVWIIHGGTSTGWMVTNHLPFEEALFFFLSNCMVVCGVFTCQRTLAAVSLLKHHQKPSASAISTSKQSPAIAPLTPIENLKLHITAILTPDASLPQQTITDIHTATEILSNGSKSFSTAALLFPQHVREIITALYSFCRVTDDIADEGSLDAQTRIAALSHCRTFVDAAYSQSPIPWTTYESSKVFTAQQLAALRIFATYIPPYVPRHAIHELLDGYTWDLDPTSRIRTSEDLVSYCAMVASSVGEACCNIMMLTHDPEWDPQSKEGQKTVQRARDMGVALQMVNMARDVATDALEFGRLYVPDKWVREVVAAGGEGKGGVLSDKEVEIAREKFVKEPWGDKEALRRYAELFLTAAEPYAESAAIGAQRLPPLFRKVTESALTIYMSIGDVIRSSPEYPARAVTSNWLKVTTLIKTMYT
ncbi:hypothetical protein HK097_001947 [Rhizophlyctis rosea]|uniref:Bifunctional lycopene cyclase/phytoene synthase n=1 Tax=Rhizophlyctis rosea TaxID=64517 RepID=A0AAD5SHD8_9FUNG|nr:hypothetical protein HK097_001947 [Rhizophlyctis rosea]